MLEVYYQKKFLKDLADIPTLFRKDIEHFVFEILPTSKSFTEIK